MKLGTRKRKLPPGVRFHPTDVELVLYYLQRMVSGKPLEAGFVAEVEIYQFHPAALKALAFFGEELNWYFFCSTGKKYGSGARINRATPYGFWKPTGNDRIVLHERKVVGKVKTLVFHEGKPAKGVRTDWVMHEYRLEDAESSAIVLCKIFKKGGLGPRNGEQFGAAYNAKEWESPIAAHSQILSAEMNEDDLVSADDNTNTVEQVHQTSTSNGVAPDVAPSSRGPVGDPIYDMWCSDDFRCIFDNLDVPVSADPITTTTTTTTEQLHSDAVSSLSVVHQVLTPTSKSDNANPFHKNPTAGGDIASSSMAPVPERTDEMFCAADFGITTFNIAELPYTTFDEFDI